MKLKLPSLLLYPLPLLSGLTASHGADNTWTNGDGDSLWNDSSANWESPATWTNGDDAIFGSTGAGAITVGGGISAGSLTFNASGYNIGGSPLTLTGSGQVTAAASTDNTISSVLAGSAGLTKAGAGWLRLSGANTYSGTTTVTGGALFASNASGPSLPGNVTLGNSSGNVFLIPTASNQFANGSVLNFNNGLGTGRDAKFQLRGTNQTIYGLNSASTNNLSIIQNDESGTPGYSSGGGTSTLTIDSNTNDTFYGLIRNQSGTLNLVKTGSGTLTLINNTPGDSGFGSMTVTQGAVHFGNGEASAGGDGNVRRKAHGNGVLDVATGASVRFYYDRRGDTLGGGITGGGDIEFRANSSSTNTGSNDYIISTSNDGFTGNITVTDARLRTQNTASPFGDQSQVTITTSGNGQVMYHANPGGTYQYQLSIGGLGYYESNGTRLGALRLEHGSVQAGAVTLTGHAGIGSQDNGTTPGGTISGVISDGGNGHGITKLGAHPITLTAVNTYSGATVVQTGTLALSGSGSIAASTTIEVQAGAFLNVAAVSGGWTLGTNQTLTGSGTVIGDFTALGIVATGTSAGTLNVDGTITLTSGSLWEVELGGTASGEYDQLLATGGLDAGGVIALSLIDGFTPTFGDSFQIAGFDSFTDSGYSFDISGAALGAGLEWDFSSFASNGTISVIPESSTALLAGLGAFVLLRRRR